MQNITDVGVCSAKILRICVKCKILRIYLSPITFDGKRKAKIEVTAMHVNIKWVGGYILRI